MSIEIIFMLLLLLATMVALAGEWFSIDLTALMALVALVIFGVLKPEQALSGFANEIIFVLASIFIMSAALARSGITYVFAEFILKLIKSEYHISNFLMILVASASAFFSNTSSVGILMPVTLEVAHKAKIKASRLLMPLAFASILGGTCTLIGTSTNLASAGLIVELGLEPFSLFEFVVPGLILTAIGILYLSIIGSRLIPQREKANLTTEYLMRDYLSELRIEPNSPAVGNTIGSLKFEKLRIIPLTIVRGDNKLVARESTRLRVGDKIIIKCPKDSLLQLREDKNFQVSIDSNILDQDITADDIGISEYILMPQSRLIGRTLKQLNLNRRYQVSVLALYRHQVARPVDIQNTRLRIGDVVLVQGDTEQLNNLAASYPYLWVSQATMNTPLTVKKGIYVLVAMVCAVLLTSLSILPPSIAFLSAVIVLILAGCMTMENAYRSIEWRLLVLIACMSSFGIAMQETGTAAFLAEIVVEATQPFGLHSTLLALAVLTIIFTQPMSNAAAALVLLPVAVSTANLLGVDARPFVIMVTLSASLSFITPLEPASLLVYGVGKYKFLDFVKVGLPLTAIAIVVLIIIVPMLWPF